MKQYYVAEAGASPHGPYTEDMVKRAFEHGMYPPGTKLWWEGAPEWVPMEYVWGGSVKQAEPPSAPPPPPPPPPSGYTNTPYMPPPAAPSSGWNVINAFTCNMKRYAHFEGRSCKSEYWYFILAQWILGILSLCFGEVGFLVASFIMGLALFVPNMAICYRRLQDAGYEGTAGAIIDGIFNFIGLCTIFVEELPLGYGFLLIALIVIGCLPSKNENNPYGASPLRPI